MSHTWYKQHWDLGLNCHCLSVLPPRRRRQPPPITGFQTPVCAVEPRCPEVRDVDSGEPCVADVEIVLKNGTVRTARSPCLMPTSDQAKDVHIRSDRYTPKKFTMKQPKNGYGWFSKEHIQVSFLKRRAGKFLYDVDPYGSKGILTRMSHRLRSGSKSDEEGLTDIERPVGSTDDDPAISSVVTYFCRSSKRAQRASGLVESSKEHLEYSEIVSRIICRTTRGIT